MKLDPRDTERLTKLLGLLNSEHAGERATAGAMADKMLRERGLTWRDVIAALPDRPAWREPLTAVEQINVALLYRDVLTAWEIKFLLDVNGLTHFSPKQRAVLERITDKVRTAYEFRSAYPSTSNPES